MYIKIIGNWLPAVRSFKTDVKPTDTFPFTIFLPKGDMTKVYPQTLAA